VAKRNRREIEAFSDLKKKEKRPLNSSFSPTSFERK
jgi:hypothetical protein